MRSIGYLGAALFLLTELTGGISLQLHGNAPSTFEIGVDERSWSERLARLPFQICVVAGFYWLIRLFGYFKKGEIFTERTAGTLKLLSLFVVLIGVNRFLQGVYSGLIELAFTSGENVNFDVDIFGVDLLIIGFGLLLYAFSLVQYEAKTQTDDLRLIF